MVLSNKKLKQKLRAAKAELLAVSEAQKHSVGIDSGNPDSKLLSEQSVNSLLDSASQKPRLSKRGKRRERALSSQGGQEIVSINHDGDEKRDDERSVSEGVNEDKKNKKRKSNDGLESGATENIEMKKAKKTKKKKTKRKNKEKKKVGDVEINKVTENTIGVNGENGVPEAMKFSHCQENTGDIRKVYVGGIPYYSTVDDIKSYFESCGTITEVDCMKFPESGKFRGIAIISFKTEGAAKRALSFDGADMGGFFLKIQPYKSTRSNKVSDFSPAIVEGYNRIYVGNLSWEVTEEELRKLFSDCNITSIRFGENKETGEFLGYGHVDFADILSLTMALKLDQTVVCGRPVKISCAVPKKGKSKQNQTNKHVDDPGTKFVSGKIKRNTCYECGEEGHLVSSCPKKQAAETMTANNPQMSSVSGKIRRRTCYECGEKGHLASSCPKKQAADSATVCAT